MGQDKFPPEDIRFIKQSDKSGLDREDLFLLMKSYENNIQQNTIVVEQLKHILETQKILCTQINEMIDKLGGYTNKLTQFESTACKEISNLKVDMSKNRTDSAKEHSGLNLKLYVAWGGTALVIISLISLLYQFTGPLKTSIELIAKHLGVG